MKNINVPRGSTQQNVNKSIFCFLKSRYDLNQQLNFLDAPCGEGHFIEFLLQQFPKSKGVGIELMRSDSHQNSDRLKFSYQNLSKPFDLADQFDVITCISGVMEFENTSLFIETCGAHLKKGGYLVISNDSTLMLRDRISYFFLGKVARFALFPTPGSPTYKCISLQELYLMLASHGFKIEKVQYTSTRIEDWLAVPLALLLYPINALFMLKEKTKISIKERFKMFPFRSLFSRHYYLVAKKH